ncbi:MAG: hypothetical protein K6E29_01495 [Cyanobacteria bacterium RUI128]|nr:hypothetical protein [Cyanobacteria bacterium RUI128]
MAKVNPITPKTISTIQTGNLQAAQKNEKKWSNTEIIAGCAVGAVAVGAAIWGTLACKNKINKKSINNITNSITDIFKEQMRAFPEDIGYRKAILGAGATEESVANLRPIIGPQEYKSILTEFSDSPIHYTPGKTLNTAFKDGYELEGAPNKTFRATMHMHTIHSDGTMSVRELLAKSAKYADEVAESLKTNPDAKVKHAPFTIAITDHDTLEGCKEAARIISEEPERYKNLRVVLGCEMSVENRMLGDELKKPVDQHIIVNVLNPFDEKLNQFFETKKAARKNLAKDLMEKCKQGVAEYDTELSEQLSGEEAQRLFPSLRHGVINTDYSIQDYVTYKTLLSECIQKNKGVSEAFEKAGVKEINSEEIFDKYINTSAELGFNKYYGGLKKYTADTLGISEEEAGKRLVVTDKTNAILGRVKGITTDAGSKMDLAPAYVDLEDAINIIKNQESGYMTIAHPACTNIGERLKYPENSHRAMSDIFRMFKEKGGDRALGAEIYYPYFGDLSRSGQWLDNMGNYAKENKLIPTGGLDSHGKSIFYSNK